MKVGTKLVRWPREQYRRLPKIWYVRLLVIVLGAATMLAPLAWLLIAFDQAQRERACVAAGNDWSASMHRCDQVYTDCSVAGVSYPLGTTYTDGCNFCRCQRHGVRCTAKYCFKYVREERLLEVGDGRSQK